METGQWLGQGHLSKLLAEMKSAKKAATYGFDMKISPPTGLPEKQLLPWDPTEAPDTTDRHYKNFVKEVHYVLSKEDKVRNKKALDEEGVKNAKVLMQSLGLAQSKDDQNTNRFFLNHEEGALDLSEELPFPPLPVSQLAGLGEEIGGITPMQIVWLLNRSEREGGGSLQDLLPHYIDLLIESVSKNSFYNPSKLNGHNTGHHRPASASNNSNNNNNSDEFEAPEFYMNHNFRPDRELLRNFVYLAKDPYTLQDKVWMTLLGQLLRLSDCPPGVVLRICDFLLLQPQVQLSDDTWLAIFDLFKRTNYLDKALDYHSALKKHGRVQLHKKLAPTLLSLLTGVGKNEEALQLYCQMKKEGVYLDATTLQNLCEALESHSVQVETILNNFNEVRTLILRATQMKQRTVVLHLMNSLLRFAIENRKNLGNRKTKEGEEDENSAEVSQADSQRKGVVTEQTITESLQRIRDLFEMQRTPMGYGVMLQAYSILGNQKKCRECYEYMVNHYVPRNQYQIYVMADLYWKELDAEGMFGLFMREVRPDAKLQVDRLLNQAVILLSKCARFDLIEQLLNKYEKHRKIPESIYSTILRACEALGDKVTADRFRARRTRIDQRVPPAHTQKHATNGATHQPHKLHLAQQHATTYNNSNNSHYTKRPNGATEEVQRRGEALTPLITDVEQQTLQHLVAGFKP